MLERGLAQFLAVAQIVSGVGETGLAVIAPLHEMLGNAG